jgi:hypothetical protein
VAISADCGSRTDSAGVGHRSISGRNVYAPTNQPQCSYSTGAVRQFSSIEQEDDRQASWKGNFGSKRRSVTLIFESQKKPRTSWEWLQLHVVERPCLFRRRKSLSELKRQSSTRIIVVDSPFGLCFGGPTFAERSGVAGTGKVRKVSLQPRRRPRIFPGMVVLPFGRSTHNSP